MQHFFVTACSISCDNIHLNKSSLHILHKMALNHLIRLFIQSIFFLSFMVRFTFKFLSFVSSRRLALRPLAWDPVLPVFHGNQRDNVDIPSTKKEERHGFEPPTSWAPGQCEDHQTTTPLFGDKIENKFVSIMQLPIIFICLF